MEHSHAHHHHGHTEALTHVNKAFIIGITLNLLFVIIEAIVGFYINSLSLLSDAGHNLADVGSLALALLAFRLMKVKSNRNYTYGYRKTSIVVALFNSVILLISIGAIIYEAARRFFTPEPIPGKDIAIVAGIGVVINAVTAFLFQQSKEKDLNVKSAYLHLMSDAIISLVIVVGGIVMLYTNWFWIDSALSIIVAVIILVGTWHLLKESLRLTLDGVPEKINLEDIRKTAMNIDGVKDFHHIHIWAISTTENALTAHVVLQNDLSIEQEQQIKAHLRHELLHKEIQHVTLETERSAEACAEKTC